MNIHVEKERFRESFLELEKVAYTHTNQGHRARDFLLCFHNNRKVDIFGFVNLDYRLQRCAMYLLECHISSPHCVGYSFKEKLNELSKFEDL
ncbi:hypothetical protein [Ectopseudomonas mendocina]|uniref:hypothetical protein n=1 Tax=Ectopseudomonas mendocina TaxID=300 RepID=UPI0012DAE3AE|nr:hypothetical protein [Pseudomonas mendocina]